jgi:4-aminobutyrate aminotransferase
MSQNYKKDYPLVVDHAKGPVVVDADGNRYLDFAAGIAVASTGHCHPDVVAAVKRQSSGSCTCAPRTSTTRTW